MPIYVLNQIQRENLSSTNLAMTGMEGIVHCIQETKYVMAMADALVETAYCHTSIVEPTRIKKQC